MAVTPDKYVYHAAAGSGDGSSWANAYTTVAAALAAVSAGQTIGIAHDHAETVTGNTNLTFPDGTKFTRLVALDRSTDEPVKSSAASHPVLTCNSGGWRLNRNVHCYGIEFKSAGATFPQVGGQSYSSILEECIWNCGASGSITLRYQGGGTRFIGGQIAGATANSLASNNTAGLCEFVGVTFTRAATYLIISNSHGWDGVRFIDCDLSVYSTNLAYLNTQSGTVEFIGCKLNAAVARHFAQKPFSRAQFYNCDDGTYAGLTNHIEFYDFAGSAVTDTRARTGGANDGSAGWSFLMTAAESATQAGSYGIESPPLGIWVDGGSAITIEAHVNVTDGNTYTADQIWMDVSGPPDATGNPLGKQLATKPALGNAGTLSAGSGWASGTAYVLSVTYTPAVSGYVRATVTFAPGHTSGGSRTLYLDGKLAVS